MSSKDCKKLIKREKAKVRVDNQDNLLKINLVIDPKINFQINQKANLSRSSLKGKKKRVSQEKKLKK